MRPERGHSGKLIQQLSREVVYIRIKIIPNNISLIAHVKIRLEKIKVDTAQHREKQRLPEIFEKCIRLKMLASCNKIKKQWNNLSPYPQIVQPERVGIFNKEIADKTVKQVNKNNAVEPFPSNRGIADQDGANDNENQNKRNISKAKH